MELFDPSEAFDEDYLWFYEDSLTPERSSGDTAEIIQLLGLEPGATVLDAPCGHGRISNRLALEGLSVTGIDMTAQFLDLARRDADAMGSHVDYYRGDLRDLPAAGPFDAVICWFTSFGYFDDNDNQQVLREFYRVLRPGGQLLIETLNRDGFIGSFTPAPAAVVTERRDDLLIDQTRFDPIEGRLQTRRTVARDGKVRRSNFAIRLPTVPEYDNWLSAAGFAATRYCSAAARTCVPTAGGSSSLQPSSPQVHSRVHNLNYGG